MSEGNAETIRRLVDAFNAEGMAAATLDFFDPDAVFEEPPEQPGPTIAEGLDQVRSVVSKFDEAWEEHRSEPEEIRSLDDERVLLLHVEHFRGRGGIEITQPGGTIFTLRGGKVTRMQSFWERANALEAAGLAE
jgi:ketosteroid isomerase-like protein